MECCLLKWRVFIREQNKEMRTKLITEELALALEVQVTLMEEVSMRLKLITEELDLTLEVKTSLMEEASMKEGRYGEVTGLFTEEAQKLE